MDSAQERKLKYYLREVAKLLKEDTPEEQLQDFESIELAARKHIVETVGPEIGAVFFSRRSRKRGGETATGKNLHRSSRGEKQPSEEARVKAENPSEPGDGEMRLGGERQIVLPGS